MRKLTEIPVHDRPREKLILKGANSLNDNELFAVILGSGNKKNDVVKLAKKVNELIFNTQLSPVFSELTKIDGIGKVGAAKILAVIEFAKRQIKQGIVISSPEHVTELVSHLKAKKQEHFAVILLNGANEVLDCKIVTIGLLNQCQIHAREVFSDAISQRAAAVILAHNHPAAILEPSKADISVTELLKSAGKLLGIPVLDHVIFNTKGYFSFKENGLI